MPITSAGFSCGSSSWGRPGRDDLVLPAARVSRKIQQRTPPAILRAASPQFPVTPITVRRRVAATTGRSGTALAWPHDRTIPPLLLLALAAPHGRVTPPEAPRPPRRGRKRFRSAPPRVPPRLRLLLPPHPEGRRPRGARAATAFPIENIGQWHYTRIEEAVGWSSKTPSPGPASGTSWGRMAPNR